MSTELPAHSTEKLRRLESLYGLAKYQSTGMAVLYYIDFVTTSSMHHGDLLLNSQDADERFLGAVGLSAEAGEVLDQFKKAIWHKGERGVVFAPDREDAIKKEIGDVLWYLMLLIERSGHTLHDIMLDNMAKLIGREKDKIAARAAGKITDETGAIYPLATASIEATT